MFMFGPSETRNCQEVAILDDDVVEDLEEDFVLVIEAVDPDMVDPTTGENPSTTVTITDDDGELKVIRGYLGILIGPCANRKACHTYGVATVKPPIKDTPK